MKKINEYSQCRKVIEDENQRHASTANVRILRVSCLERLAAYRSGWEGQWIVVLVEKASFHFCILRIPKPGVTILSAQPFTIPFLTHKVSIFSLPKRVLYLDYYMKRVCVIIKWYIIVQHHNARSFIFI